MEQEKEEKTTAMEMFEELKELRGLMRFQWKKSNIAGALKYLDKIIEKTDKYIEILQTAKNN